MTPLPELLDAKRLQRELGVTRAAAEAIMRRLPIVQIEGLRKTYVTRAKLPPTSTREPSRSRNYHREPGRASVGFPRQDSSASVPLYPSGV